MLKKCDQHYFLSWGWISTWLESLKGVVEIQLVVGLQHNEPMVAFFIGVVNKKRFGVFSSRILSLNTAGSSYFDELYLEYNGILKDPSIHFSIDNLLRAVDGLPWDEFLLPGLSFDFVNETDVLSSSSKRPVLVLVNDESLACYVNLDKVREANLDYLRLISSNKRSQIRRSIKEYEKNGSLEISEAKDKQQALNWFEEMVVLHQNEWNSRGRAGAFSNEYLLQFHKDLIASRFELGEIQILKVFTSSMVIGVLYNFIYNGRVYFYQSGLNYLPGNIYRPGMVAHYYAILHNTRAGLKYYDFLAGDAAYKISLSTDTQPVYWLRLFRNPLRYYFALGIRRAKVGIKSIPGLATLLRKLKSIFRRKDFHPENGVGFE